jgi:hypothetical protein
MSRKSKHRKTPISASNHLEPLEARQFLSISMPSGMAHAPVPDAAACALINDLPDEFASLDGTGNNTTNVEWGSTGEQLLRLVTAEYGDGLSQLAGEDRISAREVSNIVAAQSTSILSGNQLTNMLWVFGQFVDHDIDLTTAADPVESAAIDVPAGDVYFDPDGSGDDTIAFSRSVYDTDNDVRQQLNVITAFLDGSVIYGSDEATAASLREGEGGRLKTSDGDLLPLDDFGFFMAGDIRANENVALIAMQTVWMREHNHWADQIAAANPELSDQQVFDQARSIVVGELQAVTYNEYLPALLGAHAIEPYRGYDATVNPGIANIFSTAAYRFGHSMLSSELVRLDADGNVAQEGNILLRDAFFNPSEIVANGIDSILRGVSATTAQEIDPYVVDDVRNFLFGAPGSGGFDLVSLNIQRGRDHGLPDYNQARVDMGLEGVTNFSQITSDVELAAALEQAYGDVDNIDVWVGGLAEDHLPGANVGELFHAVMVDQFSRIRDGDRFWYQNVFSGAVLERIHRTSLADVIERNTDVQGLQRNVFVDADAQGAEHDRMVRRMIDASREQRVRRGDRFSDPRTPRLDDNDDRMERSPVMEQLRGERQGPPLTLRDASPPRRRR